MTTTPMDIPPIPREVIKEIEEQIQVIVEKLTPIAVAIGERTEREGPLQPEDFSDKELAALEQYQQLHNQLMLLRQDLQQACYQSYQRALHSAMLLFDHWQRQADAGNPTAQAIVADMKQYYPGSEELSEGKVQ